MMFVAAVSGAEPVEYRLGAAVVQSGNDVEDSFQRLTPHPNQPVSRFMAYWVTA